MLVSLQLPSAESKPAGILLWDPEGNKLFVEIRRLTSEEDQEDLTEVWAEFSSWLSLLADELGGLETLEYLESGASHIVQIGARTETQIAVPERLLRALFEAKVAATGVLFTSRELSEARTRLPILPSSAVQVIAALNNPLVDAREVERAISQDPTFAAHIIRLANSGSFAIREPARSLESAIRRIGFERTKLYVVALSVGKMYSSPQLRKIWDHSLVVAQIARQLARASGQSEEEAALLSIIHDIGLIALFALGAAFESAYLELQVSGMPSVAAEEHLCGVNHAEVGADLLASWKFPKDMSEAVRHHHSPSQAQSPFASLLHLAESWLEGNEDTYNPSDHAEALQRLGLQTMKAGVLRETLDPDLQVLRAAA